MTSQILCNPADPFEGTSPAAERIRAFDWSTTPLGAPGQWSASLRTVVRMMLKSRFPMWMCWGPELSFFCNDAYAPTLGIKRAWAIGARSDRVWEEIWPDIGPRIARVFETDEATWDEELFLFLERSGYKEETYHTFSYSPLADDDGAVRGMLCVVAEDTDRVLAERRVATLRDLGVQTAHARSVDEACRIAMDVLEGNRKDFPYARIHLLDAQRTNARVVAGTGLSHEAARRQTPVALGDEPRLAHALQTADVVTAPLTQHERAQMTGGPWSEPPTHCFVAPMIAKTEAGVTGLFSGGLNPHRRFDSAYRSFVGLVSAQIATAIANANAHEEERRRVAALAEIDRAKTAFFSNVSHEFRTPLTLMLGPLEDVLRERPEPRLEMVHRNGLRLMRLVNALLDFSRVEAGRATARFEPTDLGAFTAELAANFRSAFDKAGLTFEVDVRPVGGPVAVDRAMWERIVLNLLSNAFKFTLEGGVDVTLARDDGHVELTVADTGVGIPPDHLPRVFERFHRIEDQQGRTHEGTGIGLALVSDLVALHGGDVRATSLPGRGSTFTVRIPVRSPGDARSVMPTAGPSPAGMSFVEEALRWLPDEPRSRPRPEATAHEGRPRAPGPCIVLADDNADMRAYVERLLTDAGYDVVVVGDGEEALAAAQWCEPALVLSDVMMPRLDGLGLARALREDPSTASIPLMLLSARTGDEARIEGLGAGADDYLTKPFTAAELVARVRSTISHAQQRAEMLERAEASATQMRLVADAMPALVSYVDREERYRFNNRAYTTWFGREAAGQTLRDVLGDAAYAVIQPHVRRVLAGEKVTYEAQLPYKDGGHRQVEATYLPDIDTAGITRGFYVFVYDLTERLRKDAALAESEARLRRVFEAIDEGYCLAEVVVDVRGLPVDYRFLETNPLFEDMTGLKAAKGKTALELVPDLEPFWLETYARVGLGREPVRFEHRSEAMGRDFDVFATPVEPHGRLVIVFRDITERNRATERLRRSERTARLTARIADETRNTASAAAIADTTMRILREELRADRCAWAEVESDQDHFTFMGGDAAPGVPPASGRYPASAFGAVALATLLEDRPFVCADVEADLPAGADRRAYAATGIRALIAVPLHRGGRFVAGTGVHMTTPRRWTDEEVDLVRRATERCGEAIERARAETALAESEARFREMADNSPVIIWVTEADGSCVYLSRRWYEFTGQTRAEGLGFGWLEATHPDDKARSEQAFREANAVRAPFSLEYRLRRADGEYRWCIDAASPRLGAAGEFLGYIGTVIDFTERKRTEARSALMIHELNHRVKNTLAVVQSLALQGLRASQDDPRRFKEMFVGRLTALAQAHDLLTRSDWAGAALKDMLANALSAFASLGRFSMIGPDVRVPARAAVPLSMAFHELATNAAKYGALSADGGRVVIQWRLEDVDGDHMLDLAWAEFGGPTVSEPLRRGFGSRLIEQGLRHELEGEISMEFAAAGLRCHMRIPLRAGSGQ